MLLLLESWHCYMSRFINFNTSHDMYLSSRKWKTKKQTCLILWNTMVPSPAVCWCHFDRLDEACSIVGCIPVQKETVPMLCCFDPLFICVWTSCFEEHPCHLEEIWKQYNFLKWPIGSMEWGQVIYYTFCKYLGFYVLYFSNKW